MIANIWIQLGFGVGGLFGGVVIGWLLLRSISGGTIRLAKRDAEQIVSSAGSEGEALKQKIELEA